MQKLTMSQTAIYEMDRFGGGAIANIAGDMFFDKAYSADELCAAVRCFLRSCETMHTRIVMENEVPMQSICSEPDEDIELIRFESKSDYEAWAAEQAKQPVDIFGKLYRFFIVNVCGNCGIYCVLHHIIGDAWSMGVIAERLCEILSGKEIQPVFSYSDYIQTEEAYEQSKRFEKDESFWLQTYDANDEVCFLSEKQVKSNVAQRAQYALTKEQSDLIRAYCMENEISEYVLFLSAVSAYFYRVTEKEKFYIGTPVLNRSTIEEKNTVGAFINTVPLSVAVDGEMSYKALTEQIGESVSSAFRHQKYPYSLLLKTLRAKRNRTDVLFDVMLSYQNVKINGGARVRWYCCGSQAESLQIHIDDRNGDDIFHIDYDYQVEKYTADEIERIHEHITNLLLDGIRTQTKSIHSLKIMSDAEYKKVVCEFNDTAVDYPRDKCVHELFEEQVEKAPDKTAVIACDKTLTYSELNKQANRIAHSLIERGVKPGDIVAFKLHRRSYLLAAMFGILKSGAAYMPIDPDYPQDRVEYMLEDSKAVLCIDDDNIVELLSNDNSSNPRVKMTSESLCYCIYTSGSTGKPKGTLLKHQNVVNYCNNNSNNSVVNSIIKESYETIAATTTVGFDIFVTESILPLLNGFAIIFADEVQSKVQSALNELLKMYPADVLQTTPTKMKMLSADSGQADYLRTLKAIILGGEAFDVALYEALRKMTDAHIFNIYGPTEATVWVTNTEVTSTDITIGKPIANTQVYIVDKYLNPVSIGITGELCIAGDGVGAGYLNRPELTAEKFVDNPFGKGKMYKTGDLAYWREDGNIMYVGRNDFQVKIRGLRIELGEIENAICSVDGVSQSVVVVRKDENGRQLICAFYTGTDIDRSVIREHIAKKLPKYMLPHIFTHLDAMPLTTSGKVNRNALPEVDLGNITTDAEYVAPTTETEKQLCTIIAQTLGAETVGINDDFFDLGGDSLVAISLTNKIESAFSVRIDMKTIFENSVIKDLAQFIQSSDKNCSLIPCLNKTEYIITPQQAAVFAACQREPESLVYNMPMRLNICGLDKEMLSLTIQALYDRHKVFHTRFEVTEDGVKAIYDEAAKLNINDIESEKQFARPFDLAEAPLLRAAFCGDFLLLDTHHIICDGTSVSSLFDELKTLYDGEQPQKEGLWYGDYAEHFKKELANGAFGEHIEFYKNMLDNELEPVQLPESKTKEEEPGANYYSHIPADVFAKCKLFAKSHSITETALLFGIYGILLNKYTSNENIVSGLVMSNRIHIQTAQTIGMFVNTLPVCVKPDGELTDYLNKVNNEIVSASKYQELPFAVIADSIGFDKTTVNNSFVYQALGNKKLLFAAPEYIQTGTAKFDLTMELTPEEYGCTIRLEYNSHKYGAELMKRLSESYIKLLKSIRESISISEMSILSDDEYNKVVYEFNDTAVDYPRDKCVHELFEEQVLKTPDKTAVIACDKTLTYSELNEQANRIAHSLIEKGIKPGDIIAFKLHRRSYLLAAMFGILKTGAAYMPIDPDYPQDRIEYMLEDSEAAFCLDDDNIGELLNGNNSTNLCFNIMSESLCYCIYTSGTTGNPKGVLICHRNLCNFCSSDGYQADMCYYGTSVLSTFRACFDGFGVDSILPLVNGLTVILPSEDQMSNTEKLSKLASDNMADVIQTTPSLMTVYCQSDAFCDMLKNCKIILTAAEALLPGLFRRLKSLSNAAIYNGYGPSETTIGASFGLTNIPDITIGKPISNTQIYILDKHNNPVAPGVIGELCIAGDCVGLGYLNRPELTNEKFVDNPFGKGKMYKTGDLANWHDDGNIEYIGRNDFQVKIHGFRIELGEIENAICSVNGVSQAVVVVHRNSVGRQLICAFYTGDCIDQSFIHAQIIKMLPIYMMPSVIQHIDSFPISSNGKTDINMLIALEEASFSKATEYICPCTTLEKKVCSIIEDVLMISDVGLNDRFFDIGGDSLKAIEVITKLAAQGLKCDLSNITGDSRVSHICKNVTAKIGSNDCAIQQPKKIADNVYRINDNDSMIFLIVGRSKALLIDSGYGSIDLIGSARCITDLPIILTNTHKHPDHCGGNYQIKNLFDFSMSNSIDLGNRTVDVIPLPGHTNDSVAFFDHISQVLFLGDSVFISKKYLVDTHNNIIELANSLQSIIARIDFSFALNSHENIRIHIDDIIEYIKKVRKDDNNAK